MSETKKQNTRPWWVVVLVVSTVAADVVVGSFTWFLVSTGWLGRTENTLLILAAAILLLLLTFFVARETLALCIVKASCEALNLPKTKQIGERKNAQNKKSEGL